MRRSRRSVFVVVRAGDLLIYLIMALVLVADIGLGLSFDRITRALNGVRSGVTFAGMDVSGRYSGELYGLVADYAASIDSGSLTVMSGTDKATVVGGIDLEATVQRILKAQPGADVEPVFAAPALSTNVPRTEEVRLVPTDQKAVAIAINVAWGEEYLDSILDSLEKSDARASFFFVGTWAKQFPDMVRRIAAEGHEVANHGLEHIHPLNASDSSLKRIITDNESLLYSLTGYRTRLFAPPYGEVDSRIVRVASELGYWTIMWDLDTIDWQRPSPDVLVSRVQGKVRPGSIVLMHPTEPTARALPAILRYLTDQGYRVVTVSDLMRSAH